MEAYQIKVFTLDPDRFPLEKMQELVTYLHDHDQHYVMMVDPAVAYQNYSAFENGESAGIFLKNDDGSIYQGKPIHNARRFVKSQHTHMTNQASSGLVSPPSRTGSIPTPRAIGTANSPASSVQRMA